MNVGLAVPRFSRDSVGFLRGQIIGVLNCPVDVGDERQWLSWLTDETVQIGQGGDGLAAALIEHSWARNTEPPTDAHGVATRALQEFESLVCHRIADRLGEAADRLASLPDEPGPRRQWSLTCLRSTVHSINLKKLIQQIDNLRSLQALGLPTEMVTKLGEDPADRDGLGGLMQVLDESTALRALGLPVEIFDDVPPELVRAWSARARRLPLAELRVLPQAVRTTLLCAQSFVRRKEITDLLGQVFTGLLHQILVRVEHRISSETTAPQRSGTARDALLLQIAQAAIERPDDPVRSALYPVASEDLLRQLLLDNEARESAQTRCKRAVLRSTYCAYFQQVLKLVLAGLEFRCLDAGCWPIMAALGELHGDYTSCWSGGRFYDSDQNIPFDDVVPPEWRTAVVDRVGRIERNLYELCVLQSLRELLCFRRVYLAGAAQWGRPGVDWPAPLPEVAPSRHDATPTVPVPWPTRDNDFR